MTVKRCPRCKTDNPAIYDHCLNCGTPLPPVTDPQGFKKYLLPAVTVAVVVLIAGFLVIPALHISMASGRVLSTAIGSTTATPTPIPQYSINHPARVGDLQVAVTDTPPDVNKFNGNRFYKIILSVQNFNSDAAYTLPASDFVLSDARGNYYSSLGIGSKVSYDAEPGTIGTVDLVYIIPLDAENLHLLYTFPVSTTDSGTGRTEVSFVL